jgi:hypothetical protein
MAKNFFRASQGQNAPESFPPGRAGQGRADSHPHPHPPLFLRGQHYCPGGAGNGKKNIGFFCIILLYHFVWGFPGLPRLPGLPGGFPGLPRLPGLPGGFPGLPRLPGLPGGFNDKSPRGLPGGFH